MRGVPGPQKFENPWSKQQQKLISAFFKFFIFFYFYMFRLNKLFWTFHNCSLLRALILKNPAAGRSVPSASPALPAVFPQRLHEPHALRRQHPVRQTCGQLPWWQWRPIGVWASQRGLGGLRGHFLGSCLQDTAVPGCLHQSVCFQLLDTQSDRAWCKEATRSRPLNLKEWLSTSNGSDDLMSWRYRLNKDWNGNLSFKKTKT